MSELRNYASVLVRRRQNRSMSEYGQNNGGGNDMRDMRFYEEFQDRHRTRSRGTVIAVNVATEEITKAYNGKRYRIYEAIASVYDYPNSPVAVSGTSTLYLRAACRRISEANARELHPRLFAYLSDCDDLSA